MVLATTFADRALAGSGFALALFFAVLALDWGPTGGSRLVLVLRVGILLIAVGSLVDVFVPDPASRTDAWASLVICAAAWAGLVTSKPRSDDQHAPLALVALAFGVIACVAGSAVVVLAD